LSSVSESAAPINTYPNTYTHKHLQQLQQEHGIGPRPFHAFLGKQADCLHVQAFDSGFFFLIKVLITLHSSTARKIVKCQNGTFTKRSSLAVTNSISAASPARSEKREKLPYQRVRTDVATT
jgi:hypothetical protein